MHRRRPQIDVAYVKGDFVGKELGVYENSIPPSVSKWSFEKSAVDENLELRFHEAEPEYVRAWELYEERVTELRL